MCPVLKPIESSVICAKAKGRSLLPITTCTLCKLWCERGNKSTSVTHWQICYHFFPMQISIFSMTQNWYQTRVCLGFHSGSMGINKADAKAAVTTTSAAATTTSTATKATTGVAPSNDAHIAYSMISYHAYQWCIHPHNTDTSLFVLCWQWKHIRGDEGVVIMMQY